MKKLLALAILTLSVSAHATVDQYGDFLSGSASLPSAGTVIASASTPLQGPSTDFYSNTYTVSCTLACSVTVGLYTSTGTPVKVMTINVPAGDTKELNWPRVSATAAELFQIVAASSNLGTISGGITVDLVQNY